MDCKFCKIRCQKAGKQRNGAQKLYCKSCKRYQQKEYRRNAYKEEVRVLVPGMVRESVSIRGIARLLRISVGTVLRLIRRVASIIGKPSVSLQQSIIEVDELRTYIGKKENQCWIAYALQQHTGKVVDFVIGRRTKQTLPIQLVKRNRATSWL